MPETFVTKKKMKFEFSMISKWIINSRINHFRIYVFVSLHNNFDNNRNCFIKMIDYLLPPPNH